MGKFSIKFENLYKHWLFLLFVLKADILNIPGINNIPKGCVEDNTKLVIVSLIKCIWVFTYTPQKHEI